MNIIIIKQKLITSQNKIYREKENKNNCRQKNSLTGSTLHHQSLTTDTDCMELSNKQYDDERLSRYAAAAAAASSSSLPMLK